MSLGRAGAPTPAAHPTPAGAGGAGAGAAPTGKTPGFLTPAVGGSAPAPAGMSLSSPTPPLRSEGGATAA
eukprot:6442639-Prymnesium_polylepis.1